LKGINWDNVGLGTKPDGELARELGVHRETVKDARVRRSIPIFKVTRVKLKWESVVLGSKPDGEIAKELGTSLTVVSNKRNELGIPNFRKPPKHIDWDITQLGTKPDTVLARELGISRKRVENARKSLGISAFIGLILLQEDLPCRSIYEAMYDAYLHWKHIPHEHEARIDGLPYIADFKLADEYVEIAGMLHYPRYQEKFLLKKKAYQEANIPVTWLVIEDVERLYSTCPIPLKFRVQRTCLDCGKQTHDLVKGVCRTCYMIQWHKQEIYQSICEICGKIFSYHDNDRPKYCSRPCYWKSLEFDWPSWEWIDEQLQHMSIRQLAIQMRVKYTALYMRIRRRKQGQ